MQLETPILFCVFNRPDLTERVFEAIAKQRPRDLLVACDGPRLDRSGDKRLVADTRAIFERIDWPCRVEQFYRKENYGCRLQMANAITWGFSKHEQLIILEDDCLPCPSFFGFCEELLNRYRDDERVMMISGDNFQPHTRSNDSYYFSNYSHIWGWASWRRAWSHYDLEMNSWPGFRDAGQIDQFACDENERDYWRRVFDRQHAGQNETWDYSWAYACWKNHGLTILPETNLVSNIGFRSDGTHTMDAEHQLANKATGELKKIVHPSVVGRNCEADEYTWNHVFCPPNLRGVPNKHDAVQKRSHRKWSRYFGRRAA